MDVQPCDIDVPTLAYQVTDPDSAYYDILEGDVEPTDKASQIFNQSMIESKKSGDLTSALPPMTVTPRRSQGIGIHVAAVTSGVQNMGLGFAATGVGRGHNQFSVQPMRPPVIFANSRIRALEESKPENKK